MQRIEQHSADKKLQSKIDRHNRAVESYHQRAADIQQPAAIAADELKKPSVETLAGHRETRQSEWLKLHQDRLQLERQRLQLLEALTSELDEQSASAEKALDAARTKVKSLLNSVGVSIETMRAVSVGDLTVSERQFNVQVEQTPLVVDARQAARQALDAAQRHAQAGATTSASVDDAATELRQFVARQIETGLGSTSNGRTPTPV